MEEHTNQAVKSSATRIRGATVHESATLEDPVNLSPGVTVLRNCLIGRYTYISAGTHVSNGTTIGRFCSIAMGCELGSPDHPTDWLSTHPFQYTLNQFRDCPEYASVEHYEWRNGPPLEIGNDVWIGAQAVIRRGIKIGDGAVVGANSTVVSDVPAYTIVAGCPARIIRMRFSAEIMVELLRIRWWDLPIRQIKSLPFDNIQACIARLKQIQNAKT